MSESRMQRLSELCAKTHTPSDVVKHLREELHELDLALDRFDRNREDITGAIEEATDVIIEINTFFTMLRLAGIMNSRDVEMMFMKLNKFQQMLEKENELVLEGKLQLPINRYKNIDDLGEAGKG